MPNSETPWEVYYDCGDTVKGVGTPPPSIPGYGVVVVAQKAESQRRCLVCKWDFYYWNSVHGEWWGCDLQGLLDRLSHRLPTELVCQGRTVSTELYEHLKSRADQDHVDWLRV